MRLLSIALMLALSTSVNAQGFKTFTAYQGDCVKKDIVESAFLKKIPKTEYVYKTENIAVLKHPEVETYLELVFAPNGCFIGTDEISEEQFTLLKEAI